jgi:hypothetical protein
MSNLKLDLVLYLGDPDEGASTIPSTQAEKKADEIKGKISFAEGVYGAITIEKNGRALADKLPDPAISLVTRFVRAVPFLIDGEPETALLSESEYGFMFEPSGDDVLISCYSGSDSVEPEEFLIEREPMSLEAFAEQSIGMCERLVGLIKKVEPEHLQKDDYSASMLEFLDMAKQKFRTFRLERERGVRR